jgi:arabinofuranan 3-O-arabinosyltransferase
MQILHFLLRPRVRWVICWLILLVSAGVTLVASWRAFNQAGRSDGNRGHATIDFGGQWLMGRMIVQGEGRHLYLRNYQRPIVQHYFPSGVESPKQQSSDAQALMDCLLGSDDPEAPKVFASLLSPLAANNPLEETLALASAQTTWTEEWLDHATAPRIGGALYPPIHALYYAPLALLRPRVAYRVMQGIVLALAFFAGWVIQRMTEGRVWWPVASLFVLMFPGFAGCITLGQNGMFILTLLLVGWWQLMRGRQVLAGLCWGLLAFKPVWAASFFLVPLLTTRWRMAASMAAAGIVQIAVTLPIVGWEGWWNWRQIGQYAVEEYKRQENWIFLSRDLQGIPRRWLLTFEGSLAKDVVWKTGVSPVAGNGSAEDPWDDPVLAILGWGLWTAALSATLWVAWRRRQRRKELTGLFPAFVLMGAVLTCYHFMYYDFVVVGLPVLLLFTQPRRCLQWRFAVLVTPLLLLLMLALPALGSLFDPSFHFPPFETFVLLLLWAWCGYSLLKRGEGREGRGEKKHLSSLAPPLSPLAPQRAELGADVGGTHKRFADQHGADAGRL